MDFLIKVGNRRGQCIITIPRKVAAETGLDMAKYAKLRINSKGALEVTKIDFPEEKKG